jgi:predicted adenine nucleotide alpha hydrolase (AANH) superfamily ATPase
MLKQNSTAVRFILGNFEKNFGYQTTQTLMQNLDFFRA